MNPYVSIPTALAPAPVLRRFAISPPIAALMSLSLAAFGPLQLHAQSRTDFAEWHAVAEAAGTIGGTWLEGPRAPTVSSRTGFLFGLGLERGVSRVASVGGTLRAGLQPLQVHESGETWQAGTLTEVDALATISLQSRRPGLNHVSLDVGGGAAVTHGSDKVLPFQDAKSLSPLGEVGVALRRRVSDAETSGRDLAVILRYSTLRLSGTGTPASFTSGWVGRIIAGVRVTR